MRVTINSILLLHSEPSPASPSNHSVLAADGGLQIYRPCSTHSSCETSHFRTRPLAIPQDKPAQWQSQHPVGLPPGVRRCWRGCCACGFLSSNGSLSQATVSDSQFSLVVFFVYHTLPGSGGSNRAVLFGWWFPHCSEARFMVLEWFRNSFWSCGIIFESPPSF